MGRTTQRAAGFAIVLYLAVSVVTLASGFVRWYLPGLLSSMPWGLPWGWAPVYRARVLAPTLDYGISEVLHLRGGAALMVGVAVNAAAFGVMSVLLRRMLPSRIWLVLITALAASQYVLASYDELRALAVVAAFYLAVQGGREWAVALAVALGVATHEAALLVLPAMLLDRRIPYRTTVVATVAGVMTYLGLHVGLHASSVQRVALAVNARPAGLLGLAGGVLLAAAVLWTLRGHDWRQQAWYWLICSPYLAVIAVGGQWIEMPRLVAPLLLSACLLASGSAGRQVAMRRRIDARPSTPASSPAA